MNWKNVARFLEKAANKRQKDANVQSATAYRLMEETVYLLRTLAAAIRAGLR